jgi:hypothetical protein
MLSLRDIEASCRALGHEWLDRYPHCCSDCLERGLAEAHRAGQEAMRERCAALCDNWEEATYCAGWREMEQGAQHCAEAIRAMEVEL